MKKYYSDVDTMNYKKTRPDVSFSRPEKPWITDCLCVVCCRRKEEDAASKSTSDAFSDYHGISPDLTAELTAHMAFLLPQKVWGFVFKTRTWGEAPRNAAAQITNNIQSNFTSNRCGSQPFIRI